MEKETRNILKIAILGPESSGKTNLSQQLAAYYQDTLVEEFVRDYLHKRNGRYTQEDLLYFAQQQQLLEEKAIKDAKRLVICDTSLLTIKIWSLYKYGSYEPGIIKLLDNSHYDFHLLLYPDLPYEEDPLRENSNIESRKELFFIHKEELQRSSQRFAIVDGMDEKRFFNALQALQKEFSL